MLKKTTSDLRQQAGRQLGQFKDEALEAVKKQPGEMAGQVLEQLGVTAGKGQTGQARKASEEKMEKEKLAVLEAQDKVRAKKRVEAIEQEMTRLRWTREEQLRQRREQVEQERQAAEEAQAKKGPLLPETTSKPKRGGLLLGLRRQRQKTQPEMVGRRRSG